LLSIPQKATTDPTPVVFVFHGHGGTMQNAARTYATHTLWPEALVVYPQGLNTPGQLTDPEGKKPGWQRGPGAEGDRDLKFFDAMLASLRKDFHVDDHRIYAAGHSNGGSFTYLLWAMRGDQFAAFAPSAAAAPALLGRLQPKPVLHAGGQNDPLVKFAWQQATIDAVLKLNQCGDGQPGEKYITTYPSKIGAPVVTLIHPGGHQGVPEERAAVVKFFQENAKP
jgi:polyhydroxybutyrate depolymerase